MKRQVYVIEWLNDRKEWETWEIHGRGDNKCEGGGLPFYKERLRRCRSNWPEYKFRLVRYIPEK